MDLQRLRLLLTDQRGIALPMALMVLLLLSVLMIAFLQLATSEPVIASNQLRVAQARAIAEAGLERAAWALDAGDPGVTTPVDPTGIPWPLAGPAAAPYNGGTAFPVSLNGTQVGVFTAKVTPGAVSNERDVEAFGWVPTNAGAGPKTHQRITATLVKIRFPDPPAALSVRGEIDVSGNSLIDSRADTSCGNKAGSISLGATTIGSGAADIFGADGNNTRNEATDALQNQPQSVFDAITYTNAELDMLKALAKARGTYYKGSVTFNAGNHIPDGLIYIDTVTGNDIDAGGAGTTPTSDFASVDIHGGSESGADGIFNGWLIVAGNLSISGDFHMQGLAYVLNDFTYTGTGTGLIEGAVISQNVRDTSATTIDTNTGGNAAITYNCAYAKYGGGAIPPTWALKAGTYKEVTD